MASPPNPFAAFAFPSAGSAGSMTTSTSTSETATGAIRKRKRSSTVAVAAAARSKATAGAGSAGGGGLEAAAATAAAFLSELTNHAEFVEALEAVTADPMPHPKGRIVVYRGSPQAKLMVIGEAPGETEDRVGGCE